MHRDLYEPATPAGKKAEPMEQDAEEDELEKSPMEGKAITLMEEPTEEGMVQHA